MSETIKGVFDALYSKLILRDVVGKMAPGLFVLFALEAQTQLISLVPGTTTSSEAFRTLMLLVAGWFVALALQSLGETTRILRMWPEHMQADADRYQTRIEFARSATEEEKHQAERFALIGESAGVMTVACLVVVIHSVLSAIVSLTPHQFFYDSRGWLWRLGLGVAIYGLRRTHRSHCGKRYKFMKEVIAHVNYCRSKEGPH